MLLTIFETKANKKSISSRVTYWIKWETLEDKEVRKKFASSMSAKFRELANVSGDIEMEWSLFWSAIVSSAARVFRPKRLWLHPIHTKLAANSSRFWPQHSAAEEMVADLNNDHSISMSSETSGSSRNFADMLDANCFLSSLSSKVSHLILCA